MNNRGGVWAVACALIAVGCRPSERPAKPAPRPRPAYAAAAPVRYTIPSAGTTAVDVKTLANASCWLRPGDGSGPERGAQLFTDDDGYGRFFVHPKGQGSSQYALQCEGEGKAVSHPVELRIGAAPTAELPLAPSPRPLVAKGTLRPAITKEEAERLTDEELSKRGYPLPPSAEQSPQAYALWVKAIGTPTTLVKPKLIANPDVVHDYNKPVAKAGCNAPTQGTSNSQNWSGDEITGSFAWVSGIWNVPTVSGEGGTDTWSSLWIGIDGDGTTDLVQDGTEQDITANGSSQASTYRAWTEFLPQQPSEQAISGFSVSPGDQIFTELQISNAGGSPTLSGFFGYFVIMNLTTSTTAQIYTPVGSTTVGGSEAVWILERPTLCVGSSCSLADLANYGTSKITQGMARKPDSARHQGYVNCCDSTANQITMQNAAGTANLSTVTLPNANEADFTWQAFH